MRGSTDWMISKTTGLHTSRAARCRQYMTGICFPHLPATELAPDLLTVTELDSAILEWHPYFDLLQMVTLELPSTHPHALIPCLCVGVLWDWL